MVFPIAGGTQDTGYEISNSLRFNDDDSPNLSITPSSAGNRAVWTWSAWVKISNIKSGAAPLFTAGDWTGGSTATGAIFYDSQIYTYWNAPSGGTSTTAKFRDPSAWYHIVLQANTSTLKVYVNSVEQSSKSISGNGEINNTSAQVIGKYANTTTDYFDGYMSEINFVDGSAKAPTDFGETNDNGVWIPKKYTGSYGTNGFFLEFKQTGTSANASGIGADTSGGTNHFTPSNLAAIDVTTDTPTNNFCTLNSIAPDTTGSQNHNFFEGNTLVRSSSASWFNAFGTIGIPTSGKWYYEYKTTGSGSIDQNIGFVKGNFYRGGDGGIDQVDCYSLYAASNGNAYLYTDSASSVNKGTGYHWTHDDIMMVAIDTSSRKIWYGKNGTFLGSGDPASGSNEVQTVSAEDLAYGLLPAFSGYHTQSYHYVNFGNPSFSISSGNADANGYGNFEYSVPSGYYSLCSSRS